MRHPDRVFLLAGFVLIAPALLLAAAVVGLAQRGPLGWIAAVALLFVTAWLSRWALRRGAAWWRSTKAPARPATPPSTPASRRRR